MNSTGTLSKGVYQPELVSIITPSWNAEETIIDCIDSVYRQTYPSWEMLIADDGSSDNTISLIEQASIEQASFGDSRIKLIKMPENGGPAKARNAALKQAKGRWIAFLDSDDIWLPEKLTAQLSFHKSSRAIISFTEYRRFLHKGNMEEGHLVNVPERLNYTKLLGNTAIANSTVIVDRDLTGPFEMKLIYNDDFGCWLELLRAGGFAAGLKKDLMRYRVKKNSVSRNKWRAMWVVWKAYREVEKLNLFRSGWYFCQYAFNVARKYRKL